MSRCRVLGVVSLPVGTFKSAGANPQSSVLFVQKKEQDEIEELNLNGYPIFMAVAEDVGYDLNVKTAPPVYWKKPNGELILDKKEKPIIASDMPRIIELFQNFLIHESISFLSPGDISQDQHKRNVKSTIVKSNELTDRLDGIYYSTKTATLAELKTKGLNIELMSNLVTFPKAKTPKREEYTEIGVPVIKLKNIRDDFIDLEGCDYVTEKTASAYFSPDIDDIVVTAAGEGTIGRACIITEKRDWIATGEVMILRHNKKINPYYLLYYLRSEIGRQQLIRFSRGSSGQTHLYSKDVSTMLIPLISPAKQNKYETEFLKAENLKNQMNKVLSDLLVNMNAII